MKPSGLLQPFSFGIALLAVLLSPYLADMSLAEEIDLPIRKAGLWDMKMRMTGGGVPTMSMQQCTDAATDKDLRMLFSPLGKDICTRRSVEKTADGYTVTRVCTRGDDTVTTRIDVSGDFQSAYQAHLVSRTQNETSDDPPSSDMTMTAKYLGACKAGQKPGDVVMMGGMTMNIRDIVRMREQKQTDGTSGAN